jgi:cytochrome c-type biogenesis protein CcmF
MGYLLQLTALISGVIALAFYALNFFKNNKNLEKYGNIFLLVQAVAITVASGILVYALAVGNFKMEYVAQYTDKSLPFIYKISAFWAGQAGSLLFWGWLISVFAAIEIFRLKNVNSSYKSVVFFTMAITVTFFLVLTSFVTNPFSELPFTRYDGLGMNPLLQNPGMLYHPPTLYLGFVGITLPIGHALASLVVNDTSNYWVKLVRPWAIISWIFLTIGIVLGGQWAYVELGWGGYWAWDPVENASLLPWLTLTAYLHSAIIYEKKNKLRVWTYMLALITFELAILGTFITRSGVIDSVHSFGKSALGSFFIWFMLIVLFGFLYFLFTRRKEVFEKNNFSLISKEGLFFIANWLFFGLMFVILFGTTLPIISEAFMSNKTSVGIPYYNKVSIPFFMGILILSGIAPLMPYGNTTLKDIIKKQWPSAVFMVVATGLFYSLGYHKPLPLVLFAFTAFSFFTILSQIFSHIIRNGIAHFLTQKRFMGALIIHLGVVIMAYGIIASAFYKQQREDMLNPGDKIQLGRYTLVIGSMYAEKNVNYLSLYVPTKVYKDGKYLISMKPEKRFYNNNENSFAEPAIYTTGLGDLYLIFSSFSIPKSAHPMLDEFYKNNVRRIKVPSDGLGMETVFEPFIVWIWVGCIIMVIGGFLSILGKRKE